MRIGAMRVRQARLCGADVVGICDCRTATELRSKLDEVRARLQGSAVRGAGATHEAVAWSCVRHQTRLSDAQKTTWVDFWRAQQAKVHARLEDKSSWTDTVKVLHGSARTFGG